MTTESTRILVVDDNEMSRNVIRYRLMKEGLDVVPLASGEEALQAVDEGSVGLIFLDLLMEGLSGLDVLARLKADDEHRDIPVVVVSGVEDTTAPAESLAAGAADFLPKPVKAATLMEIVSDLLGPSDAQIDSHAPNPAALPVLDPAAIDQLSSDYGADKAQEFVFRFRELAPDQLEAVIEVAQAADGTDHWRRGASALKGSARTIGLMRLATTCRVVERALDDNRLDDAIAATGALEGELDTALAALADRPAAV